MPNHIINELKIDVPLAEVAALALNTDGEIDFEVLLPVPLNYWMGGVGIDHKAVFPGNALDWATANWGTKWNAYGQGDNAVHKRGFQTVLTFQTAWASPMGWVVALFNKLQCSMVLTWKDEGRDNAFVDRFWIDDREGPRWKRDTAPDAETERMAVLFWGAEAWADIKREMAEESAA